MTDTVTLTFILVITCSVDSKIDPRCECLTYTKTFGKEFGTFNSPDYPRPYPWLIECLLFTFVADSDDVVEITFKDFDIYKRNQKCTEGDYLKVYAHLRDGKVGELVSPDRILCGKYPDIPHIFYSSMSTMILEFHSGNGNVNCSGFVGTFRFLDKRTFETDDRKLSNTDCDKQFESVNGSLHGRFYSPRYPASYPKSIRCHYQFKARPDERIKLKFEEVILQKGDDSCINREDLIKVYDGYDAAATMVLQLCNELSGEEVFSTGPNLYVEFLSNSPWPGQGFKATFYFQPTNELQNFNEIQQAEFRKNMRSNDRSNTQRLDLFSNKFSKGRPVSYLTNRSSCDKYIRSTDGRNGSLTSPLYPRPYPDNSRCLYVFQAFGRERVQLVFEELNLQNINNELKFCSGTDSIIAYNKIEERLEKINTFCGQDVGIPIMSGGSVLVLEFTGLNSSSTSTGFKAIYNFVEDFGVRSGKQLSILPCAFEYNSTTELIGKTHRTFHSPNYPGLYPRNTECHYFFYARPDEKIKIFFEYFNVEGVPPCDEHSESDFVELSNYMAHDINYARYCGNLTAFIVVSRRSFFRVSFRSNHVLDGPGFRASYQFVNQSLSKNTVYKSNFARVQKPRDFLILHICLLLLTQRTTNFNIISYILKRLIL